MTDSHMRLPPALEDVWNLAFDTSAARPRGAARRARTARAGLTINDIIAGFAETDFEFNLVEKGRLLYGTAKLANMQARDAADAVSNLLAAISRRFQAAEPAAGARPRRPAGPLREPPEDRSMTMAEVEADWDEAFDVWRTNLGGSDASWPAPTDEDASRAAEADPQLTASLAALASLPDSGGFLGVGSASEPGDGPPLLFVDDVDNPLDIPDLEETASPDPPVLPPNPALDNLPPGVDVVEPTSDPLDALAGLFEHVSDPAESVVHVGSEGTGALLPPPVAAVKRRRVTRPVVDRVLELSDAEMQRNLADYATLEPARQALHLRSRRVHVEHLFGAPRLIAGDALSPSDTNVIDDADDLPDDMRMLSVGGGVDNDVLGATGDVPEALDAFYDAENAADGPGWSDALPPSEAGPPLSRSEQAVLSKIRSSWRQRQAEDLGGPDTTFSELLPAGASRQAAAEVFASLLALANKGACVLAQAEPFGPIEVALVVDEA